MYSSFDVNSRDRKELKERRQVNPRRFNALDKSYEPVPSIDLSLPNLETERLRRLDAIISFLPSIQPKFDTGTNCNRNPISRREKIRTLDGSKKKRKGRKAASFSQQPS